MIPGMNMNPKQMKQMERQMKKMGMEMKDIPGVKEVIIRFEDKELIIPNAQVNTMNIIGKETYQVTGNAVEVEIDEDLVITDDDIEMVSSQAGISKSNAEKALIDTKGDLAKAILKFNQ